MDIRFRNINKEWENISVGSYIYNSEHPVGLIYLSKHIGGSKKSRLFGRYPSSSLLGAGVLGDGLGSLRDGVLGQLSGQEEPDSGLDLPGGDGGPLVVVGQTGGLGSDPLEDIVDEGVHDAHGLGGDTSVGVDLFQHLIDVDGIGLLALMTAFLSVLGDSLGGLSGFLGGFS